MQSKQPQPARRPAPPKPDPWATRAVEWVRRSWRPAGTAVAIGLALLLTWHVINGKHGLSVWHQKRAEDRQLQKEIDELEQENARLGNRVERLKSNPEAIVIEARKTLHYARPGEVVYMEPAAPQTPSQSPVQPPAQPAAPAR